MPRRAVRMGPPRVAGCGMTCRSIRGGGGVSVSVAQRPGHALLRGGYLAAAWQCEVLRYEDVARSIEVERRQALALALVLGGGLCCDAVPACSHFGVVALRGSTYCGRYDQGSCGPGWCSGSALGRWRGSR